MGTVANSSFPTAVKGGTVGFVASTGLVFCGVANPALIPAVAGVGGAVGVLSHAIDRLTTTVDKGLKQAGQEVSHTASKTYSVALATGLAFANAAAASYFWKGVNRSSPPALRNQAFLFSAAATVFTTVATVVGVDHILGNEQKRVDEQVKAKSGKAYSEGYEQGTADGQTAGLVIGAGVCSTIAGLVLKAGFAGTAAATGPAGLALLGCGALATAAGAIVSSDAKNKKEQGDK